MTNEFNYSSRRLNPLTKQYVLVSPLRKQRPWSQSLEEISEEDLPTFALDCHLCPGVTRPNGQTNPDYTSIFAFNNDFPALAAVAPSHPPDLSPLFEETMETGVCEVMCYSPDHNRSMIHFSIDEIMAVIKAWQERYAELGSRPDISHVQIFETRGKEVGNSAPHPHCQIWAQKSIPSIPAQVVASQVEYFEKNSKPMMLEYVEQEMTRRVRLLYDTDTFAVVVPFWAEWPYELLILPKKIMQSLRELDDTSIKDLASCLAFATNAYAKLLQRPKNGAPYMMGIYQRPTDGLEYPGVQLFFKFISPMLTPDRQKYQAGYEKNAETQRDLTPEAAVEDFRRVLKQQKLG